MVMNRGKAKYKEKRNGALIAMETGIAIAYSIEQNARRGELFLLSQMIKYMQDK